MTTDSWINESLYPDWGQRFLVKRELARVKSEFQDIVIFESSQHQNNGIYFTNVGQELVAKAFTFAGALNESTDINNLN